MIKNYFLVTWRNLMKNKMFVFINIPGLVVALCIVVYPNRSFRNECEIGQKNDVILYYIQFWQDRQGDRYEVSPMPLANHIRENFQDVKAVNRFLPEYRNMLIGDELLLPDFVL